MGDGCCRFAQRCLEVMRPLHFPGGSRGSGLPDAAHLEHKPALQEPATRRSPLGIRLRLGFWSHILA